MSPAVSASFTAGQASKGFTVCPRRVSPRYHVPEEGGGSRTPVPRCASRLAPSPQDLPRGLLEGPRPTGLQGVAHGTSTAPAQTGEEAHEEPRPSPRPAIRNPRPGPCPGDQEGGGKKRGGERSDTPEPRGPSRPRGPPAPAPGSAADLRRAVTIARLSRRPRIVASVVLCHFGAEPAPVLRLANFGLKSPPTRQGGTAAPRQRGHRVQEGHPMELDGVSIRGG
ncbi:hypothetical protein NDU88_003444 [Pleurodeles waltl]|uniref:Uncharacterized protein n=1 Tax=Pleurodeles waltl TaxID=8319 RepID=A0AAV7VFE3_PLEWA|nr:hypothetical protein NDU88_003444 [Pleurodeles waltl]